VPATRHLRSVPAGPSPVPSTRRSAQPPPRVLLVDDVPGEAVAFRQAFGDTLLVVRDADELAARLADGAEIDVAFVDFNLSSRVSTGLSALLALHQQRPAARLVTYSQFAENGRVLFAAAARHWFGARAVLDKTQNDPYTLRHYATALMTGLDPSPMAWRARLHRAHLIDAVLPDLSWVERWRALDQAAGDVTAAAALLQLKAAHLRGFKDRATNAVNQVNAALFDLPNRGPSRNKKGILGTFVAQHTSFLTAGDLPSAMIHRDLSAAAR
jgi:CheY-like chemotaxis protein